MAIAKVIFNGETLMDVTHDTVAAGKLLSGETATKNDGTGVTGSIATKTGTDLSASGATVTVPAGYYATQATKSVATTTHPNPTASINSTTGVVTASHTQTAGYVSAGTTTGTLNLTTQGAATITPSKTEQTAVAAGRYTTGVVKVAAIPATYYTESEALQNHYPVGSLWATESSTDTPATVLGFGTWTQVSPVMATWNSLKASETWSNVTQPSNTIYVYKRTA